VPESSQTMLELAPHGQAWLKATQSLEWWTSEIDTMAASLGVALPADEHDTCWLKWTLTLEDQNAGILRPPVRHTVMHAIQAGVTIRSRWPRTWHRAVNRWLGARFYLSNVSNFNASERFAGITCSHIGRRGCHLPDWPGLLDTALQHCHRNELRPLAARDMTLYEPLLQFSQRADLRSLEICFDHKVHFAIDWLVEKLRMLMTAVNPLHSNSHLNDFHGSKMELSPPLDQPKSGLEQYPLQDRILACLSDWLVALHARAQGTVWNLASERIRDDTFPTASVYCMIGLDSKDADGKLLLDQGAVGWLVPPCQTPVHQHSHTVYPNRIQAPYVQSVCMPLSALAREPDSVHWPYLTHCTRGCLGPLPQESIEKYLDRVWTTGYITDSDPFATLIQILDEGRLRGNSKLTRTHEPSISFSAVPLDKLLARRCFQSHLGRWDWEPFGILIQRKALQEFGARPVIYGSDADFKKLSARDQPYFQSQGKVNKRSQQDWTAELEWRVLGDLPFHRLSSSSILLFVQTKSQAMHLSRCYPWPVLWTDC
jgi:hypothetical protein